MKHTALATKEQTLAMLHQRLMIAKYGLPSVTLASAGRDHQIPPTDETGNASNQPKNRALDPTKSIVATKLLRKRFTKQDYQDYIFFDIEFMADGLKKPARVS